MTATTLVKVGHEILSGSAITLSVSPTVWRA